MRGLAGGSDSGLGSFAKPYVQVKTQDAYNKGLGQIQQGDWAGGVSTIGEWSPETALGLTQYKQKADDALALQQAKDAARNTLTPYQQEMLALKREQVAKSGGTDNPFNSKNEFVTLTGIINNPEVFSKLPEQEQNAIIARRNYLANNPETIFETSYQKKSGSVQAEQEQKERDRFRQTQEQDDAIESLIADIDANPDLLGIYSPYKAGVSRITGGKIGYSPEQLEKRGNLIRQVGAIQNSIIAEARNAGQTGINTIAEIKQATKGLDENSSAEEVKGALRAMQKARAKFVNQPKTNIQVGQKIGNFTVIGVE